MIEHIIVNDKVADWETTDMKYNKILIKTKLVYLQDLLRFRHYLFLRDVQEYLGVPITKFSVISGWTSVENFTYDFLVGADFINICFNNVTPNIVNEIFKE